MAADNAPKTTDPMRMNTRKSFLLRKNDFFVSRKREPREAAAIGRGGGNVDRVQEGGGKGERGEAKFLVISYWFLEGYPFLLITKNQQPKTPYPFTHLPPPTFFTSPFSSRTVNVALMMAASSLIFVLKSSGDWGMVVSA